VERIRLDDKTRFVPKGIGMTKVSGRTTVGVWVKVKYPCNSESRIRTFKITSAGAVAWKSTKISVRLPAPDRVEMKFHDNIVTGVDANREMC